MNRDHVRSRIARSAEALGWYILLVTIYVLALVQLARVFELPHWALLSPDPTDPTIGSIIPAMVALWLAVQLMQRRRANPN